MSDRDRRLRRLVRLSVESSTNERISSSDYELLLLVSQANLDYQDTCDIIAKNLPLEDQLKLQQGVKVPQIEAVRKDFQERLAKAIELYDVPSDDFVTELTSLSIGVIETLRGEEEVSVEERIEPEERTSRWSGWGYIVLAWSWIKKAVAYLSSAVTYAMVAREAARMVTGVQQGAVQYGQAPFVAVKITMIVFGNILIDTAYEYVPGGNVPDYVKENLRYGAKGVILAGTVADVSQGVKLITSGSGGLPTISEFMEVVYYGGGVLRCIMTGKTSVSMSFAKIATTINIVNAIINTIPALAGKTMSDLDLFKSSVLNAVSASQKIVYHVSGNRLTVASTSEDGEKMDVLLSTDIIDTAQVEMSFYREVDIEPEEFMASSRVEEQLKAIFGVYSDAELYGEATVVVQQINTPGLVKGVLNTKALKTSLDLDTSKEDNDLARVYLESYKDIMVNSENKQQDLDDLRSLFLEVEDLADPNAMTQVALRETYPRTFEKLQPEQYKDLLSYVARTNTQEQLLDALLVEYNSVGENLKPDEYARVRRFITPEVMARRPSVIDVYNVRVELGQGFTDLHSSTFDMFKGLSKNKLVTDTYVNNNIISYSEGEQLKAMFTQQVSSNDFVQQKLLTDILPVSVNSYNNMRKTNIDFTNISPIEDFNKETFVDLLEKTGVMVEGVVVEPVSPTAIMDTINLLNTSNIQETTPEENISSVLKAITTVKEELSIVPKTNNVTELLYFNLTTTIDNTTTLEAGPNFTIVLEPSAPPRTPSQPTLPPPLPPVISKIKRLQQEIESKRQVEKYTASPEEITTPETQPTSKPPTVYSSAPAPPPGPRAPKTSPDDEPPPRKRTFTKVVSRPPPPPKRIKLLRDIIPEPTPKTKTQKPKPRIELLKSLIESEKAYKNYLKEFETFEVAPTIDFLPPERTVGNYDNQLRIKGVSFFIQEKTKKQSYYTFSTNSMSSVINKVLLDSIGGNNLRTISKVVDSIKNLNIDTRDIQTLSSTVKDYINSIDLSKYYGEEEEDLSPPEFKRQRAFTTDPLEVKINKSGTTSEGLTIEEDTTYDPYSVFQPQTRATAQNLLYLPAPPRFTSEELTVEEDTTYDPYSAFKLPTAATAQNLLLLPPPPPPPPPNNSEGVEDVDEPQNGEEEKDLDSKQDSPYVPIFSNILKTMQKFNSSKLVDLPTTTVGDLRPFLPTTGTESVLEEQNTTEAEALKQQNLMMGQVKPPNWPLGNVDNALWIGQMVEKGLRYGDDLYDTVATYKGGTINEGATLYGKHMSVTGPPRPKFEISKNSKVFQ